MVGSAKSTGGRNGKNGVVLVLVMLCGVILGGFIGSLFDVSWLNYGAAFGVTPPFVLNMGVVEITFGFSVKITVSGILGLGAAVFIYRKL
ncbi:hypothetical protein AGMMS49975_18310 [Clostridia bacterium]|nr:hypothetical protein AGMMS49975_18310 [Clostridia bacterium]GHU76634.1 hypothetical protein FACS1894188_09460 [Clostridia bacterium]